MRGKFIVLLEPIDKRAGVWYNVFVVEVVYGLFDTADYVISTFGGDCFVAYKSVLQLPTGEFGV